MASPILDLTDLTAGQAIPEQTVNQNDRRLEQGAHGFAVKDKDLTAPPGSPADGDAYIVGAAATGAWSGKAEQLAYWQAGTGWLFIVPREGMRADVADEDIAYRYDGADWVIVAAGSIGGATLSTDGTFAANSDALIPSQKAVKTYVDGKVTGLLEYMGATNCSGNPNYPSASKGDWYKVSVGGKIGGASGTLVEAGDVFIANADNAGGTEASVGSSWDHIEHNIAISDDAYDATSWNSNLDAPSKNAVRDKFESLVGGSAPSVQSVTSSATVTPTFSDDAVKITAQAAGLTLANPTGTAVDHWGLSIRIKDNGTARSISYGSQYRAMGVTLPTTTVISKTLYLGLIYNSDDTKWDVVAVAQED